MRCLPVLDLSEFLSYIFVGVTFFVFQVTGGCQLAFVNQSRLNEVKLIEQRAKLFRSFHCGDARIVIFRLARF